MGACQRLQFDSVNSMILFLIWAFTILVFGSTADAGQKLYDFRVFFRESEFRLDRPDVPDGHVPVQQTGRVSPSAAAATRRSRSPDYFLRPYTVIRIGPAVFTNPDKSSAGELDSPAAEGLQGLAVGMDLDRYWSVELAGEFTETKLLQPGTGEKIAEYGMWSLLGQARLRYPVWRDRLVPYLVVGAGVGFAELNDRNFLNAGGVDGRSAIPVSGSLDTTFVGTIGMGPRVLRH